MTLAFAPRFAFVFVAGARLSLSGESSALTRRVTLVFATGASTAAACGVFALRPRRALGIVAPSPSELASLIFRVAASLA